MLTTIPARDIQPGDVINVRATIRTTIRVQVRDVATIGERTYVVQRESGALVPTAYTFPAGELVRRYSAA